MPMPYILGLPSEIFKCVLKKRGINWQPSETVLFDIDNNKFSVSKGIDTSIKLPLSLTDHLFELLEHMSDTQVTFYFT